MYLKITMVKLDILEVIVMYKECVSCIKRKTPFCPTTIECMATGDMPYYQNRFMLLIENQKLKKKLEEKDDFINKLQETKNKLDKWDYKNTLQQAKFIKYLEDEIQTIENKIFNLPVVSNERNYLVNIGNKLIVILQKYKEIIGVSDDN